MRHLRNHEDQDENHAVVFLSTVNGFLLLSLGCVLVELLLSLWDFVVLIWNQMSPLFYLAKLISDRFLGFVAFPYNSCHHFIFGVL